MVSAQKPISHPSWIYNKERNIYQLDLSNIVSTNRTALFSYSSTFQREHRQRVGDIVLLPFEGLELSIVHDECPWTFTEVFEYDPKTNKFNAYQYSSLKGRQGEGNLYSASPFYYLLLENKSELLTAPGLQKKATYDFQNLVEFVERKFSAKKKKN